MRNDVETPVEPDVEPSPAPPRPLVIVAADEDTTCTDDTCLPERDREAVE